MNKKKERLATNASKKKVGHKYGLEPEDEEEKFLNRLAIQRKLLCNFVDPESKSSVQRTLNEEENAKP